MADGQVDVARRLAAAELPATVRRLGFRGPDVSDVLAAAAGLDRAELAGVQRLADRLLPAVGVLDDADPAGGEAWTVGTAESRFGAGVLAMLAFVATAPEVLALHRDRGVADAVAWASLADLGQQVWVHRLTYGAFGLHTQEWLRLAWSGNLYRLGRLQYNLQRDDSAEANDGGWLLSTHIPQVGPLTPASVEDSFTTARRFFGAHFPDLAVVGFHCFSWLLDPHLAAALPASANMARFQRRWALYGEPADGDGDALFFTFHRRGRPDQIDLDGLPQATTLERVIVARLRAGEHWQTWNGRIPPDGGE